MEMRNREKWTNEDVEDLYGCYKKTPLSLSTRIVERHGRAGCYTKAERLGLNSRLRKGFPDLSDWNIARCSYLAGIIDGEGTITVITMNRWSKKRDKQYFYQRAIACVANTDYKLLDYLKSLNIGGLSYDKRKDKKHHKQSFQWSLSNSATVYTFLKVIEPYLIIKKDRAIEVMAWLLENKLHGRTA